ncbi:MAG TPA: sulfite exporter TauE/SafE family protein [Gemmatimonadales bacterium]|nr:sulfite exporter TauE/SafE family protein [Gemmatimonadales bacterium]
MAPLGFLLAALVGLALGLLGGGGSILTVPILVYVLGFEAKTAIAMSLPIVGAVSLAGAVGHWRAGNVRPRTALLFGLAAMAGAFLGARLAVFLSGAVQLTILAVVMLAAAVSMFRGGLGGGRTVEGEASPALVPLLAMAVGVGVLTGVVGIGGGFLIVPALVLLAGVPMKQAVGTSLLVIAMNSVAGAAGYLGQVAVPWGFMAAFTAVASLGILVGTALVRVVPQPHLKRAFALFLVGVGLFTLYQNRAGF